jgi:hypothetical protein
VADAVWRGAAASVAFFEAAHAAAVREVNMGLLGGRG